MYSDATTLHFAEPIMTQAMDKQQEAIKSIDEEVAEAPLSWAVVRNPRKVLLAVAAVLAVAAYWALALLRMKDGMVFIPMDNGELLKGFPAASDPTHEAMVFWCEEKACDLERTGDFARARGDAEAALERLAREDRHCRALEWSSAGKPMLGASPAMYMSKDKTTSFVEIHSPSMRCILAVRARLKKLSRSTGPLRVSPGGPETVADASMAAEFKTALAHSIFAVPVCGLILWLVVGNVFRAGTPMVCLAAAYITGKGMVGFCKWCYAPLNVNFDDSCVLFIALALCVDYALFFWTRFNDELVGRMPAPCIFRPALAAALRRSGTVIIISNCFVTLAYACTMLLPYLNLWAYLGLYIQAMSACAFAGVYSVTLTPALAGALPRLFADGRDLAEGAQRAFWSRLPSPQNLWKAWARAITRGPLMILVPFAAYACMLPFVCLTWRYKPSFDVERQGSRHDILEQHALAQFENNFNLGMLFPITFVLEAHSLGPSPAPAGLGAGAAPSDLASLLQVTWSAAEARGRSLAAGEAQGAANNVALTPAFGNATCELAEQLLRITRGEDCEVGADDMLALWWMPRPGAAAERGAARPGHACAVPYPTTQLMSRYQGTREPMRHLPPVVLSQMPSVLRDSLSLDGKRMLLKVMPSFRPSSPEAYHMDMLIRDKILKEPRHFDAGGQRYSLRVRHTSSMQIQVDASRGLAEAAPKVVGIFAPLAAVAIAVSFSSAFLAFKLALTVIVPIITTYGMAIAVYQLGWLDFLGLEMFRQSGGLDFRLMVLTAGILFGFAMDYDLFLFVRVYERRMEGYDNLSAVKRALAETGPVITTAGTLMIVSFFFIMCSHTIFLRTMGFIFTIGVLFDVYVVRTAIAPVFLSLGEGLNYWPGRMPPVTKHWD